MQTLEMVPAPGNLSSLDGRELTPRVRILTLFAKNPEKAYKGNQIQALFPDITSNNVYYHCNALRDRGVLHKLDGGKGWQLSHTYKTDEEKRVLLAGHLASGNSTLVVRKTEGTGLMPSATSSIENTEEKVTSMPLTQSYSYFNRHVESIIERMEKCETFSASDVIAIKELKVLIE